MLRNRKRRCSEQLKNNEDGADERTRSTDLPIMGRLVLPLQELSLARSDASQTNPRTADGSPTLRPRPRAKPAEQPGHDGPEEPDQLWEDQEGVFRGRTQADQDSYPYTGIWLEQKAGDRTHVLSSVN